MARTVYLVALALVALAAVASAEGIPVEAENLACKATSVQQAIVQALRGKKDLSEFRRMVAAATDIGTTHSPTAATLTVFAPTNAALARAFPAPALNNLITSTAAADRTRLNDIVRTHITNTGAFTTKTLTNNQALTTLATSTQLTVNVATTGGRRAVTVTGPGNTPNNPNTATVVKPNNIRACNSYIHAISEAIRVVPV